MEMLPWQKFFICFIEACQGEKGIRKVSLRPFQNSLSFSVRIAISMEEEKKKDRMEKTR
jgi:hypothetical protein